MDMEEVAWQFCIVLVAIFAAGYLMNNLAGNSLVDQARKGYVE